MAMLTKQFKGKKGGLYGHFVCTIHYKGLGGKHKFEVTA